MNTKIYFLCAVIMTATMFMLQAQNTSLPVGAIPGTIDVSPMGAATYTIPIEVVPGTQGIQPNLSIVYNSMSGMGLLGMKWNLAGLSAITRYGQTLYYDSKLETIKFNSNDRFALDGNRLMRIQGTYGAENTVYATEMEDFTRIVSYGGSLGHPSYFIAYTDDGSMIEYGNTTDSKQKMGTSDNILSWYINKITDVHGNYMTFNYGSADGEIWITSIQYTGNSGMSTYAKVEFGYATNGIPDTLGRNTAYFLGYPINQTKLLKSITVKHNSFSNYVRKYEFNYVHENAQDAGRTVHLDKITEYGEGGNIQLNSTNIEWGSKYTHLTINILSQFNFTNEKKILSGDFDGDGYADILVYNNNTKKGWQVYMYNPSTNSYPSTPTYTNSSIQYEKDMLYAQDINGDGKDEVIVAKIENNQYTGFTSYSVTSNYPSSNYLESVYNTFYSIYFGDFDGDGIIDIMFASYDSHYEGVTKYYDWKFKFCSSSTNQMPQINFSLSKSQCDPEKVDIQVINLNGNGKQNIAFFTETFRYKFEYDGTTFQFLNIHFPEVGFVKNRFCGDINGDGITDVLVYSGEWTLLVATGNGYYHNISLGNLFDSTTDSKGIIKYKPMFVDLNGDGKQDIIQGVNYYVPGAMHTKFLFIRSQGYNNGLYKYEKDSIAFAGNYSDQKFWRFGDFFGSGKQDLLFQDSQSSTLYPLIFYQQQDKNYEFVQEITDGMGKKIELEYAHKYYRFYTGSIACPEFKGFLSTVKNLKVSNGIGNGKTILQYKYSAPKFSWNRKTLMGFEGFSCTNTQNNKKDSTFFVPSWRKEIMLLFNQKSYYNNTLISERRYIGIGNSNTFDLPNGRFGIHYECIQDFDYLTKIATETYSRVTNHGRLMETQLRTYKEYAYNGEYPTMPGENGYMNLEIKNYYYQGICSSNNSQRAVLTKVVSTQQYKHNGIVVADSVMYEYDSNWHLYSETKENADGTITTKYENYTPKGPYQKKTVSAQGVTSRSENFTYDATSRFVSTATNPLGHTATITYDPKTGNKLTETDANQLTTTYTYDGLGNLKFVTYPDNTKDTLTVHWKTNLNTFPVNARYFTKTRSTGKGELRVYYDILGRELCRWEDGYYCDTRYNEKGQVVKTSYPYSDSLKNDNLKIWNNYTYDNYGRKQTETAPYTDLTFSYDKKKVTVTDHGISSYKDYDALGRIIEAKDEGGTITYQYSLENDKHKTVITTNGTTTTIISDLWGNRLSITEPNAGTITSEYNKFNELTKQTDANGSITLYSYDQLGRVTSKNYTNRPNSMIYPPFAAYTYDTGNKAKGKLSQIEMGGSIAEKFTYDNLGRLASHTKYNDGTQTFNYSYNSIGQLQKLTYPSGFAVNYTYTPTGKLQEIRRNSDNSLIYKVNSWNEFQQPLKFTYGNGFVTNNYYNQFGRITGIYMGERPDIILNYNYSYDSKGLMSSRNDYVMQKYETFTYDDLDRLTQTDVSGYNPQTLTYHNNGNILTNSLVGTYNYTGSQPHAVNTIKQNSNAPIPSDSCAVTYNYFNQPTKITEGDYRIDLSYGANQQRNKAVFKQDGDIMSTRYYFNKSYEKEVNSAGDTLHYNYIYGPTGVVALQVGNEYPNSDSLGIGIGTNRTITIDNIYYIHLDHLGSYIALTDENKNVVQRNTFDPWGNYQSFDVTDFPITARGFTGHEHYPFFKIINMNGRLYDPVIGRFFSPDKYIANSSFTQDFNRYTYARNNPLMYTDPEGEFVIVAAVIGAFVGAMINTAVNAKHITKGWQFFAYAGIGGAAGFGAGAAGVGVGAALGAGTSIGFGAGFGAGFASGFVSGFANSFATSSANTWLQGGSFGQGLFNGFKSGMISGAISGLTAGIAGGIKGIQNQKVLFNGCKSLGVNAGDPVPATDKFLLDAKNAWFQDVSLKNATAFTTENIPADKLQLMTGTTNAITVPELTETITGRAAVYFHPERAFTSAEQLFQTMGHELVHLSQYAALAGISSDFLKSGVLFSNMLEYNAYSFSNGLGNGWYWKAEYDLPWSSIFPKYYNLVDYSSFSWTNTHSFIYPFY